MRNDVAYKKSRIVRVLSQRKVVDLLDGYGTGFFIAEDGTFLTCFHVIFGQELVNIRSNPRFAAIVGNDEHSRLEELHRRTISALMVQLPDGTTQEAELLGFNETYDIASLKLKDSKQVEYFEIDADDLDYDNDVFFCGYQLTNGYRPNQYPFVVNAGRVSSFPDVIVGGEKYQHIQVNSINLGGNSGAPLFREGSNKVVAMVNGNMNWGRDDLAFINDSSGTQNLTKGTLRTPLSIAFATHLKTLQEHTNLLTR